MIWKIWTIPARNGALERENDGLAETIAVLSRQCDELERERDALQKVADLHWELALRERKAVADLTERMFTMKQAGYVATPLPREAQVREPLHEVIQAALAAVNEPGLEEEVRTWSGTPVQIAERILAGGEVPV
jgi:hypothetical protein